MTSAEMKKEFLILYDKVTGFNAPGYLDSEISLFLTKAQDQIVSKFYNPERNALLQGVEQTEQVLKYLQPLVSVPTSCAAVGQTVEFNFKRSLFKLPESHLFTLSERLIASSNDPCYDGTLLRVDVKPNNEFVINLSNPFKKPDLREAWRLYETDDTVIIYTDNRLSVQKYEIVFLKKPEPIIIGANVIRGITGPVNSPLVLLENQIIDEAVMIATGVTNPELLQIKQTQTINNL
jgi:hypothetical protein